MAAKITTSQQYLDSLFPGQGRDHFIRFLKSVVHRTNTRPWVWYGNGSNGKTLAATIVESLMGERTKRIPSVMFEPPAWVGPKDLWICHDEDDEPFVIAQNAKLLYITNVDRDLAKFPQENVLHFTEQFRGDVIVDIKAVANDFRSWL